MNKQKLFDDSINGLLKQGKKSVTKKDFKPKYHFHGLRCAIGIILDDRDYKKNWDVEYKTVYHILSGLKHTLKNYDTSYKELNPNDVAFLQMLQQMHDTIASDTIDFNSDLIALAKHVATNFDLTMDNIKFLKN